MNKTELAQKVAGITQTPNSHALGAVSAVFDVVAETLAKGEDVTVVGFGAFKSIHRAGRIGRNPRTGERVDIPAKLAAKFVPGKDLRKKMNLVKPKGKGKSN
jgi:DNA-binding protein HU-beta